MVAPALSPHGGPAPSLGGSSPGLWVTESLPVRWRQKEEVLSWAQEQRVRQDGMRKGPGVSKEVNAGAVRPTI